MFISANETSAVGMTNIQSVYLLFAADVVFFFSSLFGNSVIIHIIRTDNSMKTITNYLILNQACADLHRTLMELIHISSYFIEKRWFGSGFGRITCKFFQVNVFIPVIFTVWILTAIAVDRFYAVTRPLRSSPVSRHFRKIILLIWTWSVASSLEVLIKGKLRNTKNYFSCYLVDPLEMGVSFFIVTVSINNFLPLLMTAVLYIIVCFKLWSREVPGEGSSQNQRQVEAIQTARRVTYMMITVVVLYVLCFFPLCIVSTLAVLGYEPVNADMVFLVFYLVEFAYSGLNPYVYLTFNQKFRNGFKICFGNCIRKINFFNFLFCRPKVIELQQAQAARRENANVAVVCNMSLDPRP